MEIEILSLFPDSFSGPLDQSILKRAQEKGILSISTTQVRDFAEDKHRTVDDRPYGGGPGMVMKPGPTSRAIRSLRREGSHVVYLSPQGTLFDAKKARELASYEHLILLSGHYEGIDERLVELEVDESISIGDYVLTSGILPSLVVIEALARFIPGVLGHAEAADQDSFEEGILDCPHYTRPEEFEGKRVPEILLEGDHAKIAAWRKKRAIEKTQAVRPELYWEYMGKKGHESGNRLEVVLPVSDVRKSVRFYKKLLGFRLLHENTERATFANGVRLVQGEPEPGILLCWKLEKKSGGEKSLVDLDGYVWRLLPSNEKKEKINE